jgi:hypothetical protein
MPGTPIIIGTPADDYGFVPNSSSNPVYVTDTSGSAGNAAAGPTGSPVPAYADYIGVEVNGNLVGVSSSNPLPVSPPVVDNTVIDSETVTSTGPGITYTTTYYTSFSFQFSGIWDGAIKIEGSNDNATFFPVLMQNIVSGEVIDTIYSSGIFTVGISSLYLRYNIISLAGDLSSIAVTVIGKVTPEQDASKIIAQSVDPINGINLNTSVNNLKIDNTGALILSDAPTLVHFSLAIGGTTIIDTQGYAELHLTTSALVATVTGSSDGITYTSLLGSTVAGVPSATVTALTSYLIPCSSRYIKLTATTAGSASYFLRDITHFQHVNLGTIAGASIVANGVAPTANPILVAGIDYNGLTRRILTDTSGRIETSVTDQFGTVRINSALSPPATIQNIPVIPVQEQSRVEDASMIEVLRQILSELRINNYYMYNLPNLINNGQSLLLADDPSNLRLETLTYDT